MSQAEIWDDSALVNSWNEALEEYKHYHSIRACGENLVDVLPASSKIHISETISGEETVLCEAKEQNGSGGRGQGDEVRDSPRKETPIEHELGTRISQSDQCVTAEEGEVKNRVRTSPTLQHLIGSVHDEGLKNLLMSWYYAGYYTGLYEGQHQIRQAEAEGV